MSARATRVHRFEAWPLYELPQRRGKSPIPHDPGRIVHDMIDVIQASPKRSTSETLALLRQAYPRHPLALRLAALAAHMKAGRDGAAEE